MIIKTEGIVINYIKFRESSIIIRIFTQDLGFQSFILNGIRSIRSKKSIGVFQPLNLVELVAFKSPKAAIFRLNECKILYPTASFQIDLRKSAIVMFCSELLNKTLFHEHNENNQLYLFFKAEIISLERLTIGFESFHVYFAIKYAAHLGFFIQSVEQLLPYKADLNSALYLFMERMVEADHYVNEPATGELRALALKQIIDYYSRHIDNFGEIKSLKILQQVFK